MVKLESPVSIGAFVVGVHHCTISVSPVVSGRWRAGNISLHLFMN
jgi:hypothetical protein